MKTKNCQMAVEHLLSYLENSDQYKTEADTAIKHVSTCSYCQDRVGFLVRALTTERDDTLTCQTCEDALPEYMQAQQAGQAGGVRWQETAYHLKTCPHCSEVYADLTEMSAFALGEIGEEPDFYPSPDLSFLVQKKAQASQVAKPNWRFEAERLIIEFSAALLNAWQPPSPAAAGLKSDEATTVLYQDLLTAKGRDVTFRFEEESDNQDRCVVIVEVNLPDRTYPDLKDTEVILKRGGQELDVQYTDAHGRAIFEEVATVDLPYLVFEITPSTGET